MLCRIYDVERKVEMKENSWGRRKGDEREEVGMVI